MKRLGALVKAWNGSNPATQQTHFPYIPTSFACATPAPLQGYFGGIVPPLANAGLLMVIAPAGGGGSETLPAGGTFLFAFMHESANVRVRTRAIRVRIIGRLRPEATIAPCRHF